MDINNTLRTILNMLLVLNIVCYFVIVIAIAYARYNIKNKVWIILSIIFICITPVIRDCDIGNYIFIAIAVNCIISLNILGTTMIAFLKILKTWVNEGKDS